eukprot:CAMPEP_0181078680 /NCGR_PEP_ID=MMETSP1071-20121207/1615_1 /TAXON_ID=35127 /ORGANISM="Thalassiosira sp., Strain NH16" /LENGTH=422 /DNA_ID=CAMNT_0023160011 /DNA_START=127 /DNA_END=1395 /DNA_ORIENTATION=-
MKKSLAPPSKAAITILASRAISISTSIAVLTLTLPATTLASGFPYAEPAFRYMPFAKLDTTSQNIAMEKLGYMETTWNNHGLAPIERKGWPALTSNERDAALQLGFTQGTWDCFINHYEHYSWEELADMNVQEHFSKLGWDESYWNQEAEGVPYTEARWWDQLTSNEKDAANKLCYFEANWDKLDMNSNGSFFPHPMPNFRYVPWDELSYVTRNIASGMLNYTQATWDGLGSAVVEKNTFLNLQPVQREGALELGFYTHTWDCFMNHYQSYYWSSFHEDLKVAVTTLGWDEDLWSDVSGAVPDSENKMWDDLTPNEKAAATRLCYFKEIWDGEDVVQWYDYDMGKNTAVTADGPLPKDINLEIFQETGYAGKEPGSVGGETYTAVDTVKSDAKSNAADGKYELASSSVLLMMAVSMGAFLFV